MALFLFFWTLESWSWNGTLMYGPLKGDDGVCCAECDVFMGF